MKSDAANICRKYLDDAREQIRNTIIADQSDVSPVMSSDEYCWDGHECTRKKAGRCHYKHSLVWCGVQAVRPDGAKRRCGWKVHDDRIINRNKVDMALKNKQNTFVIYARADPIRDVIVAPTMHTTNSEMIVTPEFWSALLQTIKNVFDFESPELLYLNFGIWETQTAEASDVMPVNRI